MSTIELFNEAAIYVLVLSVALQVLGVYYIVSLIRTVKPKIDINTGGRFYDNGSTALPYMLVAWAMWTLKRCWTVYIVFDAELRIGIVNEAIFFVITLFFVLALGRLKHIVLK